MQVLNTHIRIIDIPTEEIVSIFETLSTKNDKVWPLEKWPAMKFNEGIQTGAKGGHGPIKYSVEIYNPRKIIQFRFSRPKGFVGIHKFEIKELTNKKTEISHTIKMKMSLGGSFVWFLGVRALHNALIEDCFDKVENQFLEQKKKTKSNYWVVFLRSFYTKR